MKKLLVILLFLFPVHGAWAVNLVCLIEGMEDLKTREKSIINVVVEFEINFEKRYVNTNFFSMPAIWELNDDFVKFRGVKWQGSNGDRFGSVMWARIDRKTGKFSAKVLEAVSEDLMIYHMNNENDRPITSIHNGECQTDLGKKKF